ncbi:MAG: phosphoglucosamine mutase [Rhodothermaceae bacterium]|nr:phosphoglucosamine mutase [Rhodothermaceae bacterium]
MPLIASISGIRGVFGDGLDPDVLVRYTAAFGAWCRQQTEAERPLVVVGRDGRTTGEVCARLVTATLQSVGCDVVDAGLATTPTTAMGVLEAKADGAVILSASHNPAEWNALKLLNAASEFLSPGEAEAVIAMAEQPVSAYTVGHEALGSYRAADFLDLHIQRILELPTIDPEVIRARDFTVVVDGINSVGGFAIPALLRALGVEQIDVLNGEPTGHFAHNPEPLPAHLGGIMARVRDTGADLGIVVDPDADRLAFVQDGGTFFGEELTQVVAADFLMRKTPGPFATNLSSSRAIEDVMARYGQPVIRSAVGEINVVKAMQEHGAVLGGEGNGGVILPDLHYGRDALVGTAFVLQHLAETGQSLSEVRAGLPEYHIAKHKLPLSDGLDPGTLLDKIAVQYAGEKVSTEDGVKIDFADCWVHLRKSNTEPIVRIYTEARTEKEANDLAERFKDRLLAAA